MLYGLLAWCVQIVWTYDFVSCLGVWWLCVCSLSSLVWLSSDCERIFSRHLSRCVLVVRKPYFASVCSDRVFFVFSRILSTCVLIRVDMLPCLLSRCVLIVWTSSFIFCLGVFWLCENLISSLVYVVSHCVRMLFRLLAGCVLIGWTLSLISCLGVFWLRETFISSLV